MVELVVVDLGGGDSWLAALRVAGLSVIVSVDAAVVRAARAVVLVGEGSFYEGATYLRERGLDAAVLHAVAHGAPCLGVGLGMRLLYARGSDGIPAGVSVARPMRPTPSGIGLTCGTVFEHDGSLWTRGLGLLGREDELPATVAIEDEGIFGARDVAAIQSDPAATEVLGRFIQAAGDAM